MKNIAKKNGFKIEEKREFIRGYINTK